MALRTAALASVALIFAACGGGDVEGQVIMVRAADGFESVDDLADANICVLQGTTSELELADRLPNATPVVFEDNETLQVAFIEERCDGWIGNAKQLAERRSTFPVGDGGPDSLVVLTLNSI